VQRLMIILFRLKRRGEAMNVYRRLVETLRREYQATPSSETYNLFEAVRLGQDYIPAPSTPAAASSAPTPHAKTPAAQVVEDIQTLMIGRSNQTPLVGRDRELETLRSLLLEAKSEGRMLALGQRRSSGIPLDTQRRPQCVVLMGEAGI